MGKFIKNIFRLFLVFGTIYAAFKISQKIKSGQLQMDLGIEDEESAAGRRRAEAKKFELSPRQKKIYELLRELNQVEMTDLDERIRGVTRRTIRRDLNRLEEEGLIKKLGKTKSARYVLTQ